MTRAATRVPSRPRPAFLLPALTALLLASGLAWLVLDTAFRVEGEFGLAKHPLQVWMLRVHGALAMAALVAFGGALSNHVRPFWSARRNRGAGIALLALMLGLTLTGYFLYYLGDEVWREGIATAHWIGGVLLAVALPLHVALGRRATARTRGWRVEAHQEVHR